MPRPEPTGFIPIRPNPFIVGNPVRDRSMFFAREAEIVLVRKRCQDVDRGLLMVFCGERRSGKTSILFQIIDGDLDVVCGNDPHGATLYLNTGGTFAPHARVDGARQLPMSGRRTPRRERVAGRFRCE